MKANDDTRSKSQDHNPDANRCKKPQQTLANRIEQLFKRIIHNDQVVFNVGMDSSTYTNHNRMKEKSHDHLNKYRKGT